MSNNFLDQFSFPKEAQEDFDRLGLTQKRINQGGGASVSEFQLSGHDKGLGFRFYIHADKNEMQSQKFDMEINNEIEMIEWFKDKKNKPCERVHMIPDNLLKFRKQQIQSEFGGRIERQMVTVFPLECVGGLYKDDYLRWKQGLGDCGLELSRWDKLTLGQVKTLQAEGIFTVQQFAAMSEDRINGRFPKELVQAYKNAVHFVKAQEPLQGIKDHADEILAVKQENSKLKDVLADLQAQVSLLNKKGEVTKTKASKRKAIKSPRRQIEVIEEFNLEEE